MTAKQRHKNVLLAEHCTQLFFGDMKSLLLQLQIYDVVAMEDEKL